MVLMIRTDPRMIKSPSMAWVIVDLEVARAFSSPPEIIYCRPPYTRIRKTTAPATVTIVLMILPRTQNIPVTDSVGHAPSVAHPRRYRSSTRFTAPAPSVVAARTGENRENNRKTAVKNPNLKPVSNFMFFSSLLETWSL